MNKLKLGIIFASIIIVLALVYYYIVKPSNPVGVFHYTSPQGMLNYDNSLIEAKRIGYPLATLEQIMTAGAKGLNLCAYGWLANGDAGLFMQEANPSCGPKGYSTNAVAHDALNGMWLYGPIPDAILAGPAVKYVIF